MESSLASMEEKCKTKEIEGTNRIPDGVGDSEAAVPQHNGKGHGGVENIPENKVDKSKVDDSKSSVEPCSGESFSFESKLVKKIKSNEERSAGLGHKFNVSSDMESNIKGEESNKSSNVKTNSIIFDKKKINTSNKNIFAEPGTSKTKKESLFLKMNLNESMEGKKGSINETKSDFVAKCKLAYFEDEEWADVGWGEIHLKDGQFYFIRDFLKTVILKFYAEKADFKKEEDYIVFKAKGRKSLGDSFEIVERKYKAEFDNVKLIPEFLNKLC